MILCLLPESSCPLKVRHLKTLWPFFLCLICRPGTTPSLHFGLYLEWVNCWQPQDSGFVTLALVQPELNWGLIVWEKRVRIMRCAADCPNYSGPQNLSSSNCTAVISPPQTSLCVTSAGFWNQVKFNTWLCTYSGCTSSMLWMSVSASVRACVLNCPAKIGPSRAVSAALSKWCPRLSSRFYCTCLCWQL